MNATERGIREQFPLWDKLVMNGVRSRAGLVHVVVGCGTSVHIADSIAATLNMNGVLARAVPGNEWTRRRDNYVPATIAPHVVALSRSGESTETVAAAEVSRAAGLGLTAFCCAPGSALCHNADEVVLADTHPEEGIVMTASASLMLLMGLRYAGVAVGPETTRAAETLLRAADPLLSEVVAGRSHFVFLGAGALYGVAREGALKLQEMSLSQTEAHHPLEYRHGPISLIDDRSCVIMLYHPDTIGEEAQLARELMAKGARVLGIGGPGDIELPVDGPADVRPLLCLPVLQLLGEYVARQRGLDTLAPRHLTKVVTIA
ncbi:SIS domain-containing protein [Acidomonas methanolica]|uniref:Sugar isomerase n=1 Tax=Acidomonas methanolica NBRC 104435 TaxID=1231351 RepID=A0A023D4U9_ACIMT|nr:SIS domain-containing protein [Acidomonas methanolica]MBU2655286.1 SIS domain-containing protein [Acidomonas methanolica]TCS24047.1 glucosamine--fructose-6-phosphate aminotransferase (isomerizing) [Acidomonas methanolica]GAJ29099.1 sugar isomerase [Acidomonas methanolica NBRC 104435]GBQ55529.1 putative phosphosugar isomerase [Acidomonas methanolica]GEL00128.1 sigma factor regulator FecR [Acidomonas methanolica NBRC 104435]